MNHLEETDRLLADARMFIGDRLLQLFRGGQDSSQLANQLGSNEDFVCDLLDEARKRDKGAL